MKTKNENKEKQILKRGYVTNALTDGYNIYGRIKDSHINFDLYKPTHSNYYWSEVYCETSYITKIIRKGTLLVNPSIEELQHYFEQSKINLN